MASCACCCQERGCSSCCYCGRSFDEAVAPVQAKPQTFTSADFKAEVFALIHRWNVEVQKKYELTPPDEVSAATHISWDWRSGERTKLRASPVVVEDGRPKYIWIEDEKR